MSERDGNDDEGPTSSALPPHPDASADDLLRDDSGERSARLPPASIGPPVPVTGAGNADHLRVHIPRYPTPPAPSRHPQVHDRLTRDSVLAAVRQKRTTLFEVGEVARQLSALAPGVADQSALVRQMVISLAAGLTLVLLVAMAFAGGAWRVALGMAGGTFATTLVVFGTLRWVSRIGRRKAAVELPGPALLWIGLLVLAATSATLALTWGVSEVTQPLAVSRPASVFRPVASAAAAASSATAPRADASMKRGKHVSMEGGVLYVPPYFASEDGKFDVLIHYHGNVELIEQSVVAERLNALVYIINLGEGSDKYSAPLRSPFAFDGTLGAVEGRAEGLGLAKPRIRRVALSSWSAGFGALFHILSSRSRIDRVDAVFLLDSLHSGYLPGSDSDINPLGIRPFTMFARRALAGEKLMIITHSAIETYGYADTTRTADALLKSLSLTRQTGPDAGASPKPSELKVAINAFPEGERRWLTVTSEVHQGSFHLFGCTGRGKGDHVAHLAQMQETVLKPLTARWKE